MNVGRWITRSSPSGPSDNETNKVFTKLNWDKMLTTKINGEVVSAVGRNYSNDFKTFNIVEFNVGGRKEMFQIKVNGEITYCTMNKKGIKKVEIEWN